MTTMNATQHKVEFANTETNMDDTKTCGILGCRMAADVRIDHEERGELVVCDGHQTGHKVVGHV